MCKDRVKWNKIRTTSDFWSVWKIVVELDAGVVCRY